MPPQPQPRVNLSLSNDPYQNQKNIESWIKTVKYAAAEIMKPVRAAQRVGDALLGKKQYQTTEDAVRDTMSATFAGVVAGAPGGGTGPANMMRRDFLQRLSEGYKMNAFALKGKNPMHLDRLKEATRAMAKQARNLPEEAFEPVKQVGTRYLPTSRERGAYFPDDKILGLNLAHKDPKTLTHELIHARNFDFENVTKGMDELDAESFVRDTTGLSRELANIAQKHIYWDLPAEKLARKATNMIHARQSVKAIKKQPTKLTSDEFKELYKAAIENEVKRVKDNYPKLTEASAEYIGGF